MHKEQAATAVYCMHYMQPKDIEMLSSFDKLEIVQMSQCVEACLHKDDLTL